MRYFKFILLPLTLFACIINAQAQIAASLKISEVVVDNPSGLIDEYGQRSAWIEICNTSWGTVNLRSSYLTNNRKALEDMPVPERTKLMSLIPKGDARTQLKAKERIVFFADGKQNLGTLHTNFQLESGKENFIALFDGDGHTLLDSVTIPASLPSGCSYARFAGRRYEWQVATPENVTPNAANSNDGQSGNKVAEFKQRDPHGFGMSILGMGIVFACLALLAIFFTLFGKAFANINKKKAEATPDEIEEAPQVSEDDETVVAAVIALTLKKHLMDLHDNESGVITIKHRPTRWTRT